MLVSLTYGTNISHIKGNSTVVLMHSGIVNGHQLLCDAHTVLEPHRGTAALFLFYSLSFFSTFSFYVFVTLTVLFLFLGASIVCVNNLYRTADCLAIPWQDICLYTPLAQQCLNDLNVSIALKALHKLTYSLLFAIQKL